MSVIRTARQQNIDPVELIGQRQHPRQRAASNLISRLARRPGDLTAMPNATEPPELCYRRVAYELEAGKQTVILDTTALAFIAVTAHSTRTAPCTARAPTPDRSHC